MFIPGSSVNDGNLSGIGDLIGDGCMRRKDRQLVVVPTLRCEHKDNNRTYVCFAAGAGSRDPATINNRPMFDDWFGNYYPTPPPPTPGKPANFRASTIITPRGKLTPTDAATVLIAGDVRILILKTKKSEDPDEVARLDSLTTPPTLSFFLPPPSLSLVGSKLPRLC